MDNALSIIGLIIGILVVLTLIVFLSLYIAKNKKSESAVAENADYSTTVVDEKPFEEYVETTSQSQNIIADIEREFNDALAVKDADIELPFDDNPSQSLVENNSQEIPDYTDEPTVELNNNIPYFNEYDLNNIVGEYYAPLDRLGRCQTAVAMIEQSLMPTEKRGNIGNIKPTGWQQEKYPGIVQSEPPYLYNRCHLIAYCLTAENANEKNLITGTRYFNATLMLPYEEKVANYMDKNPANHVLYRVSPLFVGNELVARGVEMEAYSVEDNGKGICFNVFVYNIQPGIEIDYRTGKSWEE